LVIGKRWAEGVSSEIRGPSGRPFGALERSSFGWVAQYKGHTLPDRPVLFIDPGDPQRFALSASTRDAQLAATALLAGGDNWQVHVKSGNDHLLALICMLAIVVTSEELHPGH
jgi:hypothetical protein